MNTTLKAMIIEVTGGNVRNHHINLRGADGIFPDDAFGGSSAAEAGRAINLRIAGQHVATDIDRTKAIFRARGAIREFFEKENVREGDLVLLERLGRREYAVSKTSKRVFKYYL